MQHQSSSTCNATEKDALRKWLTTIQWQWFITLTFPWAVTTETAENSLQKFINRLERTHRTRVGYFAAQESRPRDGVSIHFHLLLVSFAPIPQEAIEDAWHAFVRRGSHLASSRAEQESALVEHFNRKERGIEYCLKALNHPDCSWSFNRLRDFNNFIANTNRPNHQTIRSAKRAAEQASKSTLIGGSAPIIPPPSDPASLHGEVDGYRLAADEDRLQRLRTLSSKGGEVIFVPKARL